MNKIKNFYYELTGTNFGLLSEYPKVQYVDSYLFKNFQDDYNYYHTLTSDSGDLIDAYFTDEEILSLSMSGLKLWVDVGYTNSIIFSSIPIHFNIVEPGSGYQTAPIVYVSGGIDTSLEEALSSSSYYRAIIGGSIIATVSSYPSYPLSSIISNTNYSHTFSAITAFNGFVTGVEILTSYPRFYRSTPTLFFSGGNKDGQIIDFKPATGIITLDSYILGITDRISGHNFLVQEENYLLPNPRIEYWPLLTTYGNLISCIKMDTSSYLANSSFSFNFYEPFTIILVWKNNNVGSTSTPFNFLTFYNGLCSDLIYSVSESLSPNLIFGVRGESVGWAVASVSSFYDPEITKFTYTSSYNGNQVLSSYTLLVNNSSIELSNIYNIDLSKLLLFSSIGYNLPDINNFLLGELMVFDRILTEVEYINLSNYLNLKWNFDSFIDYYTPSNEISGGPLSAYSYIDYSLSTSTFNLPILACVTNITISLSSFDESVSLINKIIYEYKGDVKTISTNIGVSSNETGIFSIQKSFDNKINVILEPDSETQVSTYQINLSVVRFDTTMNKITLKGSILKCAINDFYEDLHLLDSQIIDEPNKIVLVMEDRKAKHIYLNTIDSTIMDIYLSGGDLQKLVNKEVAPEEEAIISLADLLNPVAKDDSGPRVPPTIPFAPPNLNPIRPS